MAGLDWDTAGQLNGAALQVSSNSVSNRSVAANAEGYARRLQEVMPEFAAERDEMQSTDRLQQKSANEADREQSNFAIMHEEKVENKINHCIMKVDTGGRRNEQRLSDMQIFEAKEAARKQGYTGDIHYSDYSHTSFHGSTESGGFHFLVIGTDTYPLSDRRGTANERISVNGCMAHEIVGHYEAWLKGTTQNELVLEEAQASIRASKFGVGLTDEERETLFEDAIDRLKNAGILYSEVRDRLDIWER